MKHANPPNGDDRRARAPDPSASGTVIARRAGWRRLRRCAWAVAVLVLVGLCCLGIGFLMLQRVPRAYATASDPIPAPDASAPLGGGLAGFDSPYLGHTGSWDGKGGAWLGGTKLKDMDAEKAMGLRWTFMPVYWRALEPDGPVDLSHVTPPAWRELDDFVRGAHQRGLNILMQAPVVGGNAGSPPAWAGRRQPGRSAPTNMTAVAEFAGKLAARYAPNGTLGKLEKWQDGYGVRAWELDNEPESYRTCWKGQAGDYAEFVTRVAARIRQVDSQAVIVAPAMAGGRHGLPWLEAALDGRRLNGSPAYRARGIACSIGPAIDVVSFHCYEGLETAFSGGDRTIVDDFSDIRAIFERFESQPSGHRYARKQDYWHTEGNYDFMRLMSGTMTPARRAAWRMQFFTRGFAAGIRKLCVMDASAVEQVAVHAYVSALPNPFPMLAADKEIRVRSGRAVAFHHPDPLTTFNSGQLNSAATTNRPGVWVLWAVADAGDAVVEIPVTQTSVRAISGNGSAESIEANGGHVRIRLKGDPRMAPPVLVSDRAN
jgi:hypothetical protein